MRAHLQTIHRQPPSGLVCSVLKLGDDGVMNLLLLLSEELSTDGVERVRSKLVVSLHDGEDIELKSSIEVDVLGVSISVGFRTEVSVFGFRLDV